MSVVTLAVKIGKGKLKGLGVWNILKIHMQLILPSTGYQYNFHLVNGSRDFLLRNYC